MSHVRQDLHLGRAACWPSPRQPHVTQAVVTPPSSSKGPGARHSRPFRRVRTYSENLATGISLESTMPSAYKLLQLALSVFGAVFLLVYPLAVVWPSGWVWHSGAPYESNYYLMIVGVYATLGIFLLNAARNPAANLSLIWFTVCSSVVHAAIMAVQSFGSGDHMGHWWEMSRHCSWWPSSWRCSCGRPASSNLRLTEHACLQVRMSLVRRERPGVHGSVPVLPPRPPRAVSSGDDTSHDAARRARRPQPAAAPHGGDLFRCRGTSRRSR